MSKITFSNISSGYQTVSTLNSNFDQLEAELQNKVLYRNNPSGEPNQMNNNLDMNGYSIINVGNVITQGSATRTQTVIWGTKREGTGTHSLSVGDVFKHVEVSATISTTAVMFLASESISGWKEGDWITLIQRGDGVIRITFPFLVQVYSRTLPRGTKKQFSEITLKYRGNDQWYLSGDLSA